MAKVIIIERLKNEILKKFKGKSKDIFLAMRSLGENPHKGKTLSTIGGIVIKELKYLNFRFYFITDGYVLKCFGGEDLTDLLIKFVRMSDKKEQQKVINEIKKVLLIIGPRGFE